MAASVETQKLISLSLGKIAQSRGQRGGINLHKNLLVATVLHKARTAYMMETYNFQHQQQILQRQKLQQEQLLLQQQQQQAALQQQQQQNLESAAEEERETVCNDSPAAGRDEQVCQASSDSEVGHASAPSSSSPSARSEESGSQFFVPPSECDTNEAMTVQECAAETEQTAASSPAVDLDKENSPPSSVHLVPETVEVTAQRNSDNVSSCDHIAAATKLSQDAQQFGLSAAQQDNNNSLSSCQKQSSTSGSPTCNGILKRRRENVNTHSTDTECPVANKKARVSHDSSSSTRSSSSPSSILLSFSADMSDYSSDESDSESEAELTAMHHHTPDSSSSQISNLVNIFNSGFSGLCASNSSEPSGQDSGFQSDFEITSSSSPQYTTLTKLRPESPTPGSFSRKMSEPSLMCSTEVGRLDSLPSAIVLSV